MRAGSIGAEERAQPDVDMDDLSVASQFEGQGRPRPAIPKPAQWQNPRLRPKFGHVHLLNLLQDIPVE